MRALWSLTYALVHGGVLVSTGASHSQSEVKMNRVDKILVTTQSTDADLIIGLQNQTVRLSSENRTLKNRNVQWIDTDREGRLIGRVQRDEQWIDVTFSPQVGRWYTID